MALDNELIENWEKRAKSLGWSIETLAKHLDASASKELAAHFRGKDAATAPKPAAAAPKARTTAGPDQTA